MKKVLFSVIALTALGMTQAHAETHNKTAEFSFKEKAFTADAGFMGLAGGRGNTLSGGVSGNSGGGGRAGFSRNQLDVQRGLTNEKMQGNADASNLKDLTKDKGNNDRGQDRNRCGCGGGGNTNDNRLFDRELNQR